MKKKAANQENKKGEPMLNGVGREFWDAFEYWALNNAYQERGMRCRKGQAAYEYADALISESNKKQQ